MNDLIQQVDDLIAGRRLRWKREGSSVLVELWKSGRSQRIRLERRKGAYVFSSVVAGTDFVTRGHAHWRKLAFRAWRRNALKDLVAFAFDDEDRLIGLIEQPASTLDPEELELYIELLAKECDRFEYVLTGRDVE
ncbi:MAG: hypothetical protein GY722_00185 [bacterium]|nr:hypothetical protein [bacterium]